MSTTTTEVVESPSRENIKLHVRKLHAEAALENTFSWLLKELTDLGAWCTENSGFLQEQR